VAGKIIADIIEAPYDSIRMNVANVTVLTANSSGLTYVPTGNVNINIGGTSANLTMNLLTANGIKFPATQVTSADGNTLDDYEEGTWTPVFTAATTPPTGVTYSGQVGRYTKIGKSVTVWGSVILSSKGTGGVGEVRITGLPFTSENISNLFIRGACDIGGSSTWGASKTMITASTIPGDTYVALIESGSGQGLTNPTWANQTNSSSYLFTLTYATST
jgi:hypothetical protein